MDLPRRDRERYDLQREVLSSLFSVPGRVEEIPKKNRPIRTVKPRPGRTVVSEPLEDTIEHSNGPVEPQEDSEDEEEEDSYRVLRRATKEHWVTMKEYFKSAFDAFANGDRALADELLKQGQYFNQKAREADERSSQLILERRKENHDVVTVDLHDHGTKEAIRTLKFYLGTLSGIPSQYLKLIIGDAKDAKKNSRRTKVLELLEKESIKWTEEGNPGTILIQLDDINPEDLSFNGERSRNGE
ncbi:protein of unknown function DUF1771 [Macleaya cordata]|uniref:DUF1771 domain-containing protein n=1 Tax=Macleaya cordata TaxID=56857 RepID=A0A200PQU1_MACCD|nr:protein of unknown function DUF1771 [Macleaya cordata]